MTNENKSFMDNYNENHAIGRKKYITPPFNKVVFEHQEGYENLCGIYKLCELCGWCIIDVCCNFTSNLDVVDKTGCDTGDYMMYCLNKGCENHKGVYYNFGDPNALIELNRTTQEK